MPDRLLISWQSLLMLSLTDEPEKRIWLTDRTKRGEVLVSQYSVIKATWFYPKKCKELQISPSASFDKFLRSRINPMLVIPCGDVSSDLFAELVDRNGSEDLELFAIGAAIQNRYHYQCWDEEERQSWRKIATSLLIAETLLYDV